MNFSTIATLLVDGISYGMILFLISAGLTVTLGVMRVANLAHCAFAMVGGYLALALAQGRGWSLLAALPVATLFTVALGAALERTVYRWVYATSQLGQILMTIGLVFVMIASVNLAFGSSLHTLPMPAWLAGTWQTKAFTLSLYRGFLVLVSTALAAGLWAVLEFTEFGAKLRAAVDNPRMARCVGIDVPRIFAITFAGGCGLAAIGGVLGNQMLPLEPWYALKYLVPVLIVVAVGGLGSLRGSFLSALLLGLVDTFGRYYIPAGGALIIYVAAAA
ncbi:MAG: branched-chain amino acid ABC transporter permease, partial [Alphaproteobacteria bacterium]|nr:branched-chain amino acid ABC transporter permease [Alphaproteobacteria bacterium]